MASFDDVTALDLPYDGRQAVLKAMEELELSATAAEVAAKTGLSLSETTRLLQWLVSEAKGGIKARTSHSGCLQAISDACMAAVWQRVTLTRPWSWH